MDRTDQQIIDDIIAILGDGPEGTRQEEIALLQAIRPFLDVEPKVGKAAATKAVVYRDAGTGHFVTEEYAKANPGTTIAHTVRAL